MKLLKHDPEKKKEIERALDQQMHAVRASLAENYRICFGNEIWNDFALKVVNEIDRNTLNILYVINADGELRFNLSGSANDIITTNHSNLASGGPVYAAGELVFEKTAPGKWHIIEINNGSGHYKPDGRSLYYVTNMLQKAGFEVKRARRIDSILRMDIDMNRPLRDDEVSHVTDLDLLL